MGNRCAAALSSACAAFALSEEEMEPFLKDRICGIRGRYHVTGMTWEARHGITAADIDAP